MNQFITKSARFVIPFQYGEEARSKRDYWNSITSRKDLFGGHWVESTLRSGEQDVYSFLYDQMDSTSLYSDHNVGSVYQYFSADDSKVACSLLYCNGLEQKLELRNMQAAFFSSGVGFLWFDVAIEIDHIDEYIQFLSRLKELNYRANQKYFRTSQEENFSLGSWAAEVLNGLSDSIQFFNPRKNTIKAIGAPELVPDKALIFNYAVFHHGTESAIQDAYYLTKGYGRSIALPKNYAELSHFSTDNTFWYAFHEGVGYYALSDETQAGFYKNTMQQRFQTDYFLLYLLALNQHYTLINFSARIRAVLPADPMSYLPNDFYLSSFGNGQDNTEQFLNLEQAVVRISTEINVFLARNVRSSVSYISFQNDFYQDVVDSLNINDDINSLTSGLSSLQRLLTSLKAETMKIDSGRVEQWRVNQHFKKVFEERDYLRNLAYLDSMTKVYNKNALEVYGKEIEEEARRTGKSLFVCMADMNGLKTINDTYGHQAGDNAIMQIAHILRDSVRKEDKIFRFGGDEFLIIGLCHEKDDVETAFVEKLTAGMKQFNESSGLPYEVFSSYGIVVDNHCYDLDMLKKTADEKMYEMKKKYPHR